MKLYTGKGDSGKTDTLGMGRIGKETNTASLIGDIDELNSTIGVVISQEGDRTVSTTLKRLQNLLFKAGSDVASPEGRKIKRISESDVKWVEDRTDALSNMIPPLKKFVLPGGSVCGAHLHLARAVARRAERSAVRLSKERMINGDLMRFLNRTSSLLFVCALYTNMKKRIREENPTY
ncbi:MAG: cob(I)yrinic acid a,c-diamide adenosyltransferase [Candidatus Marsarchaeota archaeon]|jgi:cob(I)alamin adenosyltransferase|nr:cob(I)yrinic acid a,c-diamide adenosyltransferase [Candidatus Marsarchaeota archaeon]MCL5115060.1 cob(I)yrinic acid a,c-diamide adenosyltransferase [Candidatus Marsarchaeota archaeon]